jgi:hypothetical protein
MLTLADVLHLLAHEFAGLRGGRLSFGLVPPCPLNRFLSGMYASNEQSLSPDKL